MYNVTAGYLANRIGSHCIKRSLIGCIHWLEHDSTTCTSIQMQFQFAVWLNANSLFGLRCQSGCSVWLYRSSIFPTKEQLGFAINTLWSPTWRTRVQLPTSIVIVGYREGIHPLFLPKMVKKKVHYALGYVQDLEFGSAST